MEGYGCQSVKKQVLKEIVKLSAEQRQREARSCDMCVFNVKEEEGKEEEGKELCGVVQELVKELWEQKSQRCQLTDCRARRPHRQRVAPSCDLSH